MSTPQPVRFKPVRKWRPVLGFRFHLHMQLPALLPRFNLQARRQRVRPEPDAVPQRRHLRQRGGLLPLPLPSGLQRAALWDPLRAVQPLAVPQRGHLRPERRQYLRLQLSAG